jgi:hypothetical protein
MPSDGRGAINGKRDVSGDATSELLAPSTIVVPFVEILKGPERKAPAGTYTRPPPAAAMRPRHIAHAASL